MRLTIDIPREDYDAVHDLSEKEKINQLNYYERLIADGNELKSGHWIKEKSIRGWDGESYQCSVCGRSIHLDTAVEDLSDYPYCHCGAKMESEG